MLNWDKLDRSSVIAAQSMIKGECRGGDLKLVDKEKAFNDLIEWKLYQLHKLVHARATKQQANSGMYSLPVDDRKAYPRT